MGCAGSKPKQESIDIDFETADPPTNGKDIYNDVKNSMQDANDILSRLQAFKGCGEYIREAITNPTPETEEAAWSAVVPSVEILKGFYEFSVVIEKAIQKLLEKLCADQQPPEQVIAAEQGLTKLLAEIFDFVLRFDDAKMTNPAIQNDFSYYRRILNRLKLSNKRDANITVNDEMANSMSLFFAYPTPMMNTLIKTTSSMTNVTLENISKFLAKMANACYFMVESGKFNSLEINMLCLRTVTGSVILYDHVNPKGAFHKKSPINIRGAVQVLKNFKDESTDGLVNALRFNTVHLNDDDTPAQVKNILA